jgi:hypothetical protein
MSCTAISSSRSGTDITQRCFLPIHVYDTASGRPVAMLLRTGKTPSGEGAGHIRRLVRRQLARYPHHHPRGHYARPEIMAFCEAAGVDYVFLPTNAARRGRSIVAVADACAVKRARPNGRSSRDRRWLA